MSRFVPQGMGWQPDLPDSRDYSHGHPAVLPSLQKLKRLGPEELPDEVDLRFDSEGEYFTQPLDQGPLNSSTAFAVLSLIEYFERRIHGRTFDGSKLFLYKITRNWIAGGHRAVGDAGADLRTTLKVLTQFGVPPEEYWPYDINRFDEEPSAFVYRLAKPFPGLRYFRLDRPNTTGEDNWGILKSFLAAGFPVAFGFPVPSSLTSASDIPYRPEFDSPRGGQAAVAVGYKNNHFGRGQDALRIRSSWGSAWGDHGNGWLPIPFISNQLAKDLWTVLTEDWLDSGELSRPQVVQPKEHKGEARMDS